MFLDCGCIGVNIPLSQRLASDASSGEGELVGERKFSCAMGQRWMPAFWACGPSPDRTTAACWNQPPGPMMSEHAMSHQSDNEYLKSMWELVGDSFTMQWADVHRRITAALEGTNSDSARHWCARLSDLDELATSWAMHRSHISEANIGDVVGIVDKLGEIMEPFRTGLRHLVETPVDEWPDLPGTDVADVQRQLSDLLHHRVDPALNLPLVDAVRELAVQAAQPVQPPLPVERTAERANRSSMRTGAPSSSRRSARTAASPSRSAAVVPEASVSGPMRPSTPLSRKSYSDVEEDPGFNEEWKEEKPRFGSVRRKPRTDGAVNVGGSAPRKAGAVSPQTLAAQFREAAQNAADAARRRNIEVYDRAMFHDFPRWSRGRRENVFIDFALRYRSGSPDLLAIGPFQDHAINVQDYFCQTNTKIARGRLHVVKTGRHGIISVIDCPEDARDVIRELIAEFSRKKVKFDGEDGGSNEVRPPRQQANTAKPKSAEPSPTPTIPDEESGEAERLARGLARRMAKVSRLLRNPKGSR